MTPLHKAKSPLLRYQGKAVVEIPALAICRTYPLILKSTLSFKYNALMSNSLVNDGQQNPKNTPLFPYMSYQIRLGFIIANCLNFINPLLSLYIPLFQHHRLEGVVAKSRAGSSPAFGTKKSKAS